MVVPGQRSSRCRTVLNARAEARRAPASLLRAGLPSRTGDGELEREVREPMTSRSAGQRIPDILDCLAQLSNDEVPTPPKLARDMLDLLPAEVWSDPKLRWLDPDTKSGVFL